ncbi:VOC family protein [Roseateles koreensis]|uniref:4-hydroxyphenylpyruvate dioxygenase n=1 Tax=Roseateles koreensis TaxID=2987526 RepID=A0ABT5KS84_9BURK|nr:VOC family protein [Roseateles koreensis]MDC8785275.1 4-hydroxyphenylpyruvate dioxygenase [Roseateles koreensis]
MTHSTEREAFGALSNPLALQGIEFIEYATTKPQTLGQSLEKLGFRPVARHRSREVMLYRQGDMNIIINAHREPDDPPLAAKAVITAVAFRVRDAASAYRRVLELGAWAVPSRVEVMELNIPAIHGVGASRIYFVDRHEVFSIYDVDFVPIPGVDPRPPALCGLHLFGLVQYIGLDRMADWVSFYGELLGFSELSAELSFGVLSRGCILASPCGTIYWQLIEPEPDTAELDGAEYLQRIAFGSADVLAAVAALKSRGVDFVESASGVRSGARGALTCPSDQGPSFELVRDPR